MKRFKVDLLIGDEDIAIDIVEGQYLSSEDTVVFEERFFWDWVDFAHVKGLFVELIDNHAVNAFL